MKQVSASAIAIAMIVAGCASSPDPAPASPPPADGQAPNGPVRGIPNPGDDDFLGAPTPTVRRHTGRAAVRKLRLAIMTRRAGAGSLA